MKKWVVLLVIAFSFAAHAAGETSGVVASADNPPPIDAPPVMTPEKEKQLKCMGMARKEKLEGTKRDSYVQKCIASNPVEPRRQ